MNIKAIFRFIGSLPFALILISTTACFAIIGTFLESITDSHRYAAFFTYGSPFFSLLLWGFFLNILISALRRYPFKRSHIPFLITHFGMLMVLGGTLIKHYFGTQGTMTIIEGSSSDEIFLPESYALSIESKEDASPKFYALHPRFVRYSHALPVDTLPLPSHQDFKVTLLDYAPNSYEIVDSWIKQKHTSIFGLPPIPVQQLSSNDELPSPYRFKLPLSTTDTWNLFAVKTDDVIELAKKVYQKVLVNPSSTLLVAQEKEDSYLFLMTKQGEIASTFHRQGNSERILAYDDGYLGYSIEASFPELAEAVQLESPLSLRHQVIPPTKKLENNIPCIAVRFEKGSKQETTTLCYNPVGNGFKWPVLNGTFLVRFQPMVQEIPYRLRLRQARQINYAGTQQPYSFESDLIITDKATGQSVESSISMNNVHETWDGYRFYLANISPPDQGSLKRVQIVVNRDPAKYFLTYPGACFMVLGILLLFFGRPKNRARTKKS